jgi:adenylylsulfate kinase
MNLRTGFAIWITGIPASGKSTITREVVKELRKRNVSALVLESDEMRKILTPAPTYSAEERDAFYRSLALIGEMITRNGINVIFDATANKQAYRDLARTLIPKFLEVYVKCPLDICMKRDPKGIYGLAAAGKSATVPGIQSPYEPPIRPEITLEGKAPPETESDVIVDKLVRLLYI